MPHEVMTKNEAEALLEPYLPRIRKVLENGWANWQASLAGNTTMALLGGRSRASMVNDWIAAAATEEFDDDDTVSISTKRGFLTLTIGHSPIIRVRFKKYRSKTLKTSGIPTQQRIAFENQWQEIDGIQVTDLVAGYLLDKAAVEQDKLALTCPVGGSPLWVIDLDGDIAAVEPMQPSLPDDGPIIRSTQVNDAPDKTGENEQS